MDTMPIAKFKAQCLSVMDRVRRTGRPLRITRYGRPVADVVPAVPQARKTRSLGLLKDVTTIAGDLVGPAVEQREWHALA